MKTSNFKLYKGDKGVAICLFPPLDFKGEHFLLLVPDRKTFYEKKAGNITEEEYEKRYRENILSKLDPKEIYERFKESVLLCWEDPGDFCHRRIVAQWLFEELKVIVDEGKIETDILYPKNKELF